MEQQVSISQLVPSCVTRRRGQEAADMLTTRFASGPVEVILDGVDMMSMSFLDGFIWRTFSSRKPEDVTFVTKNPDIEHKLSMVAGIRNSKLFVSKGKGARQPVQATSSLKLRTTRPMRKKEPRGETAGLSHDASHA